jgi:uncharacterized repeat protein (TIGR03803 family)
MKTTRLGRTLVLLATLALAPACGGGGGGGPSSPPPNSPPAASFTATPASGTAPLTVQFDASASSDPDGSIASYGWHFGNDTAAAESGMTISHVFQAGGTYTVTLTVTDNLGATGSTTRTVTVSNISVPNVVGLTQDAATTAIVGAGLTVGSITSATSATVPAGSVISQSPLAGPPVSPGTSVSLVISTGLPAPVNRPPVISGTPPMSVTVGQTYTFQPTASDPDGQTLTFSISGKPPWATFSATTGRLNGTPTTVNVGSYPGIVISVSDGTASASLPSFSINVSAAANQRPVISGTPPTSVTVGQTYTFRPTASDPDGQGLTFSIANKPSWASFETFGGRLHGIPTSSHLGTFSNIVITVSDGTASASLPAFSITVSETASPYSVVHAFIGGAEGANPDAGVIGDAAGNLYGTTWRAGNLACFFEDGCGTVFRVDASGKLLTLHTFAGPPMDGARPSGPLTRDAAGNLYGTTASGGNGGDPAGYGTVFKIDAAGNETVLHHFTGGEGGFEPRGGVLRDSHGNLYGVTRSGGHVCRFSIGCGTVFRLEPDGTFTTLHRFAAGGTEGSEPQTGLISDAEGNLYGTTYSGGAGGGRGAGTVFRIDSAGVFTTLYDFANSGAFFPGGPLMRDDVGNLYGVTQEGGDEDGGTIFRLDPEGELSILHEFVDTDPYEPAFFSDEPGGAAPYAGLVGNPAGIVYGATLAGGDARRGIVYRFDMRSHALDVLHTFNDAQGGVVRARLVRDSAGVLYGTTPRGGDLACKCGTVFRIDDRSAP